MNREYYAAGILALVMSGVVAPGLGIIKPAGAATEDCVNGTNGFVDIPDNLTGKMIEKMEIGRGVSVSLHFGNVHGVQRGWALMEGNTEPGDRVWMDWTKNGGKNWIQCGPFDAAKSNRSYTSAAQRTSSDPAWRFRACADRHDGNYRCTQWW